MKRTAAFVLTCMLSAPAWGATANVDVTVTTGGTSDEEFIGPFSSWQSVKASPCNATGDGSTDDTAAIQRCFQLLGSSSYNVYFPAGTYKIADVATTANASSGSSTITVASATGLTIGMLAWDGNDTFIPLGTTISNISGTTVTLTKPTRTTLSATPLKFSLAVHTTANGLNIVGHAPEDTSLVWAGSAQGLMLYLNGWSYSSISRLTLDGQSVAGIAIDQGYDNDNTQGSFDTANQYADMVLKNVADGGVDNLGALLRCGNLGYGCAETTVTRTTFSGASRHGVSMRNFNALDMWVWYSKFLSNGRYGLTNDEGAGDYKVYNSIFANQGVADAQFRNGGVFSIRFSYSGSFELLGPSNKFYVSGASPLTLQGNTVLDTTAVATVTGGDTFGPLTLLDNVFRSKTGSTVGPAIDVADLFSLGNTFTVTTPEQVGALARWHTLDDPVVSRSTVNPSAPTLPATLPIASRTVFEASPSGSGTTCSSGSPCSVQTAICKAATGSSGFSAGLCTGTVALSRNVVHLPVGDYNIATTLSVPISDIQIIGDSMMHATLVASGANPVLKLLGPGNKATLQEFGVSGNVNSADGVEINGADQVGARVLLDQVITNYASVRGLWADALDYTLIQWRGGGVTSNLGTIGIDVVGGTSAAAGTWRGGAVNIFGSATNGPGGNSPQTTAYKVSNGAHFLIADSFYDQGAGASIIASATGQYTAITLSGETAYSDISGAVVLNDFRGKSALQGVNFGTGGTATLTGSGSGAQNLGVSMWGLNVPYYIDTTSPADTVGFLNGIQAGCCSRVAESGSTDPTFLRSTLAQLRTTQPTTPSSQPSGVTDVRMNRVAVQNGINNIHVKN